jgi:hypothetical protein
MALSLYLKAYDNLPYDTLYPYASTADEAISGGDFLKFHQYLLSGGIAAGRGIEYMIQKKIKDDWYATISCSISRAEYKDQIGIWRSRISDNQYLLCAEWGIKPWGNWELSMRWTLAGGIPYTPFLKDASAKAGIGITDDQNTNMVRLPAYQQLNIKIEKIINFSASSLILSLSIWNIYDHKNYASAYWNIFDQKQDFQQQFGLLPILGVEWKL